MGLIKYWKGTHLIHADQRLVAENYTKFASQVLVLLLLLVVVGECQGSLASRALLLMAAC